MSDYHVVNDRTLEFSQSTEPGVSYLVVILLGILCFFVMCLCCLQNRIENMLAFESPQSLIYQYVQQRLEVERRAAEAEAEKEERNRLLLQQREQRKIKYQKFLKPYTMVVEENDFITGQDIRGVNSSSSGEIDVDEPQGLWKEKCMGTDNLKKTDVSVAGTERTFSNADDDESRVDADIEELAITHPTPVLLCLPIKDKHGKSRTVDVECIICIMEYEIGDKVVWSTRKSCPHAFHADCILVWLSKGKKRCPICRNYFVPSQSVDDKDVISHNENDMDAAMGLQTRLEEGTLELAQSNVSDGNQSEDNGEAMEDMLLQVRNDVLQHRSSQASGFTNGHLDVDMVDDQEEEC